MPGCTIGLPASCVKNYIQVCKLETTSRSLVHLLLVLSIACVIGYMCAQCKCSSQVGDLCRVTFKVFINW